MNEFNFKKCHVKGESNVIADHISRCFNIKQDTLLESYRKLVNESCLKTANGAYKLDTHKRIIIDPKKYAGFIRKLHVLSGHRGITTTYYNIKNYVYIKNIFRTISQEIKNCNICIRTKTFGFKRPKDNHILAKEKFERISTDIFGPFNLSDFKSNCLKETGFILTITDIYSRYTKLYFLERVSSSNVIAAIQQWGREFSMPKYLISDNGKQFENKVVRTFCKNEGISHILVPDYTPTSNGISERLNKTISFILTISKGKDIQEAVSIAQDTINSNYNRSIGTSPMALSTGQDLYDVLGIYKEQIKKVENKGSQVNIKIGDLAFKRKFNSDKLDPKYEVNPRRITEIGRKGFWVRLSDDHGWTHVRNIKIIEEGSMWY